jgi:hypothetical protein
MGSHTDNILTGEIMKTNRTLGLHSPSIGQVGWEEFIVYSVVSPAQTAIEGLVAKLGNRRDEAMMPCDEALNASFL